MKQKQLRDLATELDLEQAYALDPEAFAAALNKARLLCADIPAPKSFADEPAHVLVLPDRSKCGTESSGAGDG